MANTKTQPQSVRLIVSGLGNIGIRFIGILRDKQAYLRLKYGLEFQVVGAADSRGSAVLAAGLDLDTIVRLKENGGSIADYPQYGQAGRPPLSLVEQLGADVLCEATPVSLQDGEPGLSCIRTALNKGMHVVTANKGPLVLAYDELTALAQAKGIRLRFCGTVAGGLPAINLGQRDLAGATIDRLEALPNLTTSFILDQMAQGKSYEDALAAAQAQGCAEADPSLDVEGWDAAVKLVILANSVLGIPTTLDDVSVGPGVMLSGTIRDPGGDGVPFARVELPVAEGIPLTATGVEPVSGGEANQAGYYELVTVPGRFDVRDRRFPTASST